MAAVQYRQALLSDVPALARLRKEGEAGGAPEERMSLYLVGEHHPRQALAPRAMWLAEEAGRPVGYVAGHLTRRFACDGELEWIYVVGEERRRGIAAELVRLLAAWFAEKGARRICVDLGDDRARGFYLRLGAVDLRKHWLVWNDIGLLGTKKV